MDFDEYYKIPVFLAKNEVHVLEAGRDGTSFEHKTVKVNL